MRGASCSTDHNMIKINAVFSIRKKHPKSGPRPPKKLNAAKLKNPIVKDQFVNQVNNALDMLPTGDTVEEKWTLLKEAYETAKICLGKPERKHEDWFDKDDVELNRLLNDKNQARIGFLNRSTR